MSYDIMPRFDNRSNVQSFFKSLTNVPTAGGLFVGILQFLHSFSINSPQVPIGKIQFKVTNDSSVECIEINLQRHVVPTYDLRVDFCIYPTLDCDFNILFSRKYFLWSLYFIKAIIFG